MKSAQVYADNLAQNIEDLDASNDPQTLWSSFKSHILGTTSGRAAEGAVAQSHTGNAGRRSGVEDSEPVRSSRGKPARLCKLIA